MLEIRPIRHSLTPAEVRKDPFHICSGCVRNLYPCHCRLAYRMRAGCDEFVALKTPPAQDSDRL
ncbi:hypothetical protein JP09_003690 [Dehalogenimonas etheniformans]|uniref:Uncharacterized protein n=1 Tax=Dehalogenimonas etheniformans TaxID=1536648 RepID=A0A2P5P9K0_9CHLR|nr:hypothetical protein [Dehalogenimonas etheniformans]PPD58972.1 hypothetical protein JP09_003690 [Dehalogenimonas etheniformans]